MENKLRSEENKLFDEWRTKAEDNKKFAKDGAGCHFSEQNIKIIFLAKETNATSNWDTRKRLDEGIFYHKDAYDKNGRKEHSAGEPIGKTFNNIYRWANYLLNPIDTYKDYKKVPGKKDKNRRMDIFSKIAMINLKKETGLAVAKGNKIDAYVETHRNLLKKQLDLYMNNKDTKILFCCGQGVHKHIKELIILEELNEKVILDDNHSMYIYSNKLIVLNFYHPQPIAIKNQYLYELLEKVKNSSDL